MNNKIGILSMVDLLSLALLVISLKGSVKRDNHLSQILTCERMVIPKSARNRNET